jgi:ketosteroid isomerase-like protein
MTTPRPFWRISRSSRGNHYFELNRDVDPRDTSGLLSVTPMRTWKAKSPTGWNSRLAIGILVLLVGAAPLLAGMPRAERHAGRHFIDHLEDAWRAAILHGNITAMDALLADDYMAITPSGTLQSKEQTLANLRAGKVHFNSIDLTDRKIRFYGMTALVTSRAEVNGSGPEGDLSGSYRYTRVYVRDERGVWRIVSFEANRIREPGEHK